MSKKQSLADRLKTAASLAGVAISKAVDRVVTPPPSSPQARATRTPSMPSAPSGFDYSKDIGTFVDHLNQLQARRSGPEVLRGEAEKYIKAHKDDINLEHLRAIGSVLTVDKSYTDLDCLKLGLQELGSNDQAGIRLAEDYIRVANATGEPNMAIGDVAEAALNTDNSRRMQEFLISHLYDNHKEATIGYFASVPADSPLNESIRTLNPAMARDITNRTISSAPTIKPQEAQHLSAALEYTEGNPEGARAFLANKRAYEFKNGVVQIITERTTAGRKVTHSDITKMISYSASARREEVKAEELIRQAILELDRGDKTGSANLTKKFIQGLELEQAQVLSLGKDASVPAEYLGQIIAQDPENMVANALEIGKARRDLSFSFVKGLVPDGTLGVKTDAQIFKELAYAKGPDEKERWQNPEYAKKLVEGLKLEQVAEYSIEAGFLPQVTGELLRAVKPNEKTSKHVDELEKAYIRVVSKANIGENLGEKELLLYSQGAANGVMGDSANPDLKFNIGAAAAIRRNPEHIKYVMEQVPKEKRQEIVEKLGDGGRTEAMKRFQIDEQKGEVTLLSTDYNTRETDKENVYRQAEILFASGVSLKEITNGMNTRAKENQDLLGNLAMIYSNSGRSKDFIAQSKELDFEDQKNIFFSVAGSGHRVLKMGIAKLLLPNKKVGNLPFDDFAAICKTSIGATRDDIANPYTVSAYLSRRGESKPLPKNEVKNITDFLEVGGKQSSRRDVLKLCEVYGVAAERSFFESVSFGWNKLRYGGKAGCHKKYKEELETLGYDLSLLSSGGDAKKDYGTFTQGSAGEVRSRSGTAERDAIIGGIQANPPTRAESNVLPSPLSTPTSVESATPRSQSSPVSSKR